ncbi:MAG TPA: presqualene diphosphate synthase HpnD [Xanthobacteraceae bacterium]|nr:presqualene diphosphate synthase HpnD [Xanthobacteraceae bacterium]
MSAAAVEDAAPPAQKRAAGSSFYAAMRIMPKAQREAMFEIYSFCRAVDDIADNPGPTNQRLAQLQQWRADIDAITRGALPPNLKGLAKVTREFNLQREDFLAVIDGMEMDVVTTIRAPDFATLDLYCDRVASAVGRLCVRVFGMPHDDGIALAHHLGRALQLTNILRDLDEDAEIGRLYLPRDVLRDAGVIDGGETNVSPEKVLSSSFINAACTVVSARAKLHFARSEAIMARCPRSTVRTPRIMSSAYRMILDRLSDRGWDAPRRPIKLRKSQLLWVVLKHALI